MNVDQITQTAIALLGASAVWLSQSRTNRFQKWACIVGLLQQPFWFWATWRSGQWGMFLVSIVCTLLIRPCEVLSRVANVTILEVANNALRVLLQHRHVIIGSLA